MPTKPKRAAPGRLKPCRGLVWYADWLQFKGRRAAGIMVIPFYQEHGDCWIEVVVREVRRPKRKR